MNKQGNIVLPIISAVAVFALVAAGYFFWQSLKNSGQPLGPYTPPAAVNNPNSPTTRDETANWKTYKNTQLGFEFKYPNDYSLGETTNANPVYVQSPLNPARTKGYELQNGELKIEIYTASKKAIDSPEQCYKDYSGGEQLGEGSIKVGGIATTIYNWRGHGDGQSLCVISGNNRFMISKYPLQTTRQDEFDQILSTFQFVDNSNKVTSQVVQADLYPKPATWRTVDLLTPDLKVCLPPKWRPEPEGSGHIVFDRDPAYKPDVAWISRLPYHGGSRREEYIDSKTQYEPDLKSKVSVKELTINSRSILDISIYSMPEALVFADNGTLIEIQLGSWNLVNDSRAGFVKDIYTMVGCIK